MLFKSFLHIFEVYIGPLLIPIFKKLIYNNIKYMSLKQNLVFKTSLNHRNFSYSSRKPLKQCFIFLCWEITKIFLLQPPSLVKTENKKSKTIIPFFSNKTMRFSEQIINNKNLNRNANQVEFGIIYRGNSTNRFCAWHKLLRNMVVSDLKNLIKDFFLWTVSYQGFGTIHKSYSIVWE